MRILIYVEPHPIRGSHTMFNDVARRFLPLLSDATLDFDVRMYSTKALIGAIGKDALAGVQKRIIPATSAEETLFAGHLLDWETDGIPAWLSLMDGGSVADDYVTVLRRIWSVFPYDVIVHWGENGAVTRFLKERPVTRIAMELGCTRDPFLATVVTDPFGTNGNAIVPRLSVQNLRDIVGNNPMSAAEALYSYSATLETLPYEQQFAPLDGGELSTKILSTSGRIAFLPLQLHDDANLLRFSKYETVEEVVLDAVPKLAEAGYLTIIKTHPGSKSRHHSRTAFALARASLRPWADKIVWVDALTTTYSNAQLMALADLVVTVNSSVGFEALYFDKVVTVLGDAVYKPIGLFPDLQAAVSDSFDLENYRHGIGLLRRFMLGGYMVRDAVRGDRGAFENIVLTIDAARRTHEEDAVAFAESMYRSFSVAREHQARTRMLKGSSAPGAGEFGLPVVDAKLSISSESTTDSFVHSDFTGPTRRLLAHLGAADVDSFRHALQEAFAAPKTAQKLVRASGIVDEKFYLSTHRDVAKAGKDPVDHWSRYGLREGRAPRAGLKIESFEQFTDALSSAAEDLFARRGVQELPLDADDDSRRQSSLTTLREALGTRRNRVAVVAHLYYRNLVPEILNALTHIPESFDLIVTMPDWGNAPIADAVRAAYPDALLYPTINRGRHIGPFIDVLPALLERGYDAILHIQTKEGFFESGRLRRDLGAIWRSEALDALLGTPERVAAILHAFRNDPMVNEIGPESHFLSLSDHPYDDGGARAQEIVAGIRGDGFFAGSMFWIRPAVLSPLVTTGALTISTFGMEDGETDDSLISVIERLFGHLALVNGGKILGAPTDNSEPLIASPKQLAVRIEEHLEAALAEKQALLAKNSRGALAW